MEYCNYNINDNIDDDDDDSTDDIDDTIDDDDDGPLISASEGLSSETLAMLGQLGFEGFSNNADVNDTMSFMSNGDPIRKNIQDLAVTENEDALSVLKNEGVVRLSSILSPELCKKCVISILNALSLKIDAGTDHYDSNICNGFGNVDASFKRWDMYLDNKDDAIAESYDNMFDKNDSILNVLFDTLFEGQGIIKLALS